MEMAIKRVLNIDVDSIAEELIYDYEKIVELIDNELSVYNLNICDLTNKELLAVELAVLLKALDIINKEFGEDAEE